MAKRLENLQDFISSSKHVAATNEVPENQSYCLSYAVDLLVATKQELAEVDLRQALLQVFLPILAVSLEDSSVFTDD